MNDYDSAYLNGRAKENLPAGSARNPLDPVRKKYSKVRILNECYSYHCVGNLDVSQVNSFFTSFGFAALRCMLVGMVPWCFASGSACFCSCVDPGSFTPLSPRWNRCKAQVPFGRCSVGAKREAGKLPVESLPQMLRRV